MRRDLFEPEHDMFRDSFRRLLEKEIVPRAEEFERAGIMDRSIFPKLGACQPFRMNKSGSGFDGVYPDIPSGGNMYLTLLHGSAYNDRNAGAYLLNVFSPVKISAAEIPKTCSTGGPPYSTRPEGQPLPPFSFGRGLMSHNCTSPDTAFRAPPPFTTIAGEWTCQSPGTTEKLRWHFDRGIPPTDPTMSQDPCETPRGLLSLTQDQRGNALARLKLIVKRRHQIAHEADLDPGSPNTRWPISEPDATDAIDFIEQLVHAIHAEIV